MIYDWNVISLSFAKELFLDYINGSSAFDNKVIEIQSLSGVLDSTGTRYFLDRYTDRRVFTMYDANQAFLKNMGLNSVNEEHAMACFVTLSEMKKTTPDPIIDQKFKDAIDRMAGSSIEKKMLTRFLGKMEQATNCLVTTDPQYQFMPISDLAVWEKMWKFIILGEPMIPGGVMTGGFWFTKTEDGKFDRRRENTVIPGREKYLRIRSIDLDEYQDEVYRVLDGKPFSMDFGINSDNII